MEITTLADAYAFFGTKPANPRWSWSAVSEDEKTVAVTIWEDEMGPDGTYDLFGNPRLAEWAGRPGNTERIRNLQIARDHCGGLFHVIWVIARDPDESPRSIAGRYPEEHLMMRLTALDETTGEYSAVLVDPTSTPYERRAMRQRPVLPPAHRPPAAAQRTPVVRVCPRCHMALPATGLCDSCD